MKKSSIRKEAAMSKNKPKTSGNDDKSTLNRHKVFVESEIIEVKSGFERPETPTTRMRALDKDFPNLNMQPVLTRYQKNEKENYLVWYATQSDFVRYHGAWQHKGIQVDITRVDLKL